MLYFLKDMPSWKIYILPKDVSSGEVDASLGESFVLKKSKGLFLFSSLSLSQNSLLFFDRKPTDSIFSVRTKVNVRRRKYTLISIWLEKRLVWTEGLMDKSDHTEKHVNTQKQGICFTIYNIVNALFNWGYFLLSNSLSFSFEIFFCVVVIKVR